MFPKIQVKGETFFNSSVYKSEKIYTTFFEKSVIFLLLLRCIYKLTINHITQLDFYVHR